MRKKILILGVTTLVFGSSLMGCQFHKKREAPPYYLEYWLDVAGNRKENDPNGPKGSITIDEEHTYDFTDKDLAFRNKFEEVIKPISLTPKKVDKEIKVTDDKYVMYRISAPLADFDDCIIYINMDGTISTNAYAGGFAAPKAQHYIYDIGKDATKEIIDFAVSSYINE